ncbi:MAG: hypothetical protein JKY08_03800 [Flavobacteriaceae bacterium]|nr:hypothetical protein [Flavobacteriaceae bacterium]
MHNLTIAVTEVEEKLKTLLENYAFLKEENEFLHDKVTDLEQQLTQEKQLHVRLEDNFQTLKIAKTIQGSKQDRKETKLKINTLIREIDKCILQLNE